MNGRLSLKTLYSFWCERTVRVTEEPVRLDRVFWMRTGLLLTCISIWELCSISLQSTETDHLLVFYLPTLFTSSMRFYMLCACCTGSVIQVLFFHPGWIRGNKREHNLISTQNHTHSRKKKYLCLGGKMSTSFHCVCVCVCMCVCSPRITAAL